MKLFKMKFWSNWEELRILLRWKGFKGVKLTQVSHDNRSEVWGFLRKFQNLHSDQCMLLPCFVTVCDFWSCMIPNSKTTIDVLVVLNLKYISHMIYIKSLCVDMRQQLQLQATRTKTLRYLSQLQRFCVHRVLILTSSLHLFMLLLCSFLFLCFLFLCFGLSPFFGLSRTG